MLLLNRDCSSRKVANGFAVQSSDARPVATFFPPVKTFVTSRPRLDLRWKLRLIANRDHCQWDVPVRIRSEISNNCVVANPALACCPTPSRQRLLSQVFRLGILNSFSASNRRRAGPVRSNKLIEEELHVRRSVGRMFPCSFINSFRIGSGQGQEQIFYFMR
jgi:hypothetical protein